MDRRASAGVLGAACVVALLCASDAPADPWWKPSSRARLDLRLVADEAGDPLSWDAQTRSPLDRSRFMVDATMGDARTGSLYAKAAAGWIDADGAAGRASFAVEQGDYVYRWEGAEVRAFADERRYFTGDLGRALMDDDAVERFQHRFGVRADGGARAWGGTLLVTALDEGPATRLVSYARARASGGPVWAALSYRTQESADNAPDHAVLKGEVAGSWRRATAVASYEQAGFGAGVFVPGADWGSLGDGYAAAAPDNSATFLELRLARAALGASAALTGVYRYAWTGTAYANDLASIPAGAESHRLGLYASHRRYALDGRLVLFDTERVAVAPVYRERGAAASARAFLRDNSQVIVRGAVVDRTRDDDAVRTSGVVHGAYRRSLQRFTGGVHAMLDHIGEAAAPRVGMETRVNWSATSALYLRWIVSDAPARSDAVYARLEFRPTPRTWVTLAYGREAVGDGPYFLEDEDALPSADTDGVLAITVRGDF